MWIPLWMINTLGWLLMISPIAGFAAVLVSQWDEHWKAVMPNYVNYERAPTIAKGLALILFVAAGFWVVFMIGWMLATVVA